MALQSAELDLSMMKNVMLHPQAVSPAWLTQVLKRDVASLSRSEETSNWSSQVRLQVSFHDGSVAALRLKICAGQTFGRSEVDYYTRDYIDMPDAPLVKCWDAGFDPVGGYHLLLDDLHGSCSDRKAVAPTRAYGLAVAAALGRLHRHHWQAQPCPSERTVDRFFEAVRGGIAPLVALAGYPAVTEAEEVEGLLRKRLKSSHDMSLLHGDLNPTNVLTPIDADGPVYFIDRQPFDWSLTYAPAAFDLAYFLALWWPADARAAHEEEVLRCWHAHLGSESYTWAHAAHDWQLAVRQCLFVPIQWCAEPDTAETMRWLWEVQLSRVQSAVQSASKLSAS